MPTQLTPPSEKAVILAVRLRSFDHSRIAHSIGSARVVEPRSKLGRRRGRGGVELLLEKVHFAKPRGGQPLVFRGDPPGDDCEDGDAAEDDGGVY